MTECIKWTGALNSEGYPVTWHNNKIAYTHRIIANAPKGKVVLHKCDNKWCINPEHLSIGTHKDNSEDMVVKNRQAKGEQTGNSKLKETEVLEIRRLQETLPSRKVAKLFNISKTNVLDVWRRRIWRHI